LANYKTAKEDIVPFGQKIAFGSGHLANQLFPAALGVFMVVLVLALKMDPFLAGLLAAIPRLMDALTDPIMGYISDNTRSKWGRRKPYIFLGSIITGLAFMIMWQLNPENSQTYNFFYFLGWSLVFYIGYTIFATPLIGLGYEMTPDYNERTRLMAVSQWIGQIAWMIAPWFWVIIYNQDIYDTPTGGARNLAIWVGALCMILGMMPAFFNKEMVLPDLKGKSNLSMKDMAANTKEFFKGIKETITCKPFLRLCGATFLIFNGFQTIAQFAFFIIIFYLFNGDTVAAGNWPALFGTVSALATALLVIQVVTFISTRVGKRNAFIIATLISMGGYALKWWGFSPDNPGTRREGTFGAVYWWMVKLGTAMALLTSGAVLNLVGFEVDATVQAADTLTKLRLADIFIPIIFGGFAIAIMMKYDVTEKRALEIREALIARRGKVRHQGEDIEDVQK